MHNRTDRHVSDRRKAFILEQRIPQETRFTFDPFEPDMNHEIQQPKPSNPRIEEVAVICITTAFVIAAALIVKIWVGIE